MTADLTPEEQARLTAYYYSFEMTGVEVIDRILSAVAYAGKAYHHTESWQDEGIGKDKRSMAGRIQDAADEAAEAFRKAIERD